MKEYSVALYIHHKLKLACAVVADPIMYPTKTDSFGLVFIYIFIRLREMRLAGVCHDNRN